MPISAIIQTSSQASEVSQSFWRSTLDSLPTDPASLFVLALVFGSVIGLWWVGRK